MCNPPTLRCLDSIDAQEGMGDQWLLTCKAPYVFPGFDGTVNELGSRVWCSGLCGSCALMGHLSVCLSVSMSGQISSMGGQLPNSPNRNKEKRSGRQSHVGVLKATWVHSALTSASSRNKA